MSKLETPKYLHIIWATRAYYPLLCGEVRKKMEGYLVLKATDLGAVVEKIGVQPEHIHLLIQESRQLSLSDFMHELKGGSSHWSNQKKLFPDLFRWQKGFDIYNVEDVKVVRNYIVTQSDFHRKFSFLEERERLKNIV